MDRSSTTLARELATAVAEQAAGTPYAVTPTDLGFTVGVDLADAEWYGVLNRAGLRRTFVHHVRVRESDRSFSITDESRTLHWVAGVPRFAASLQVSKGRFIQFGSERVWAFDEHGRFGVQAAYRFDAREGRDLVEGVAQGLGLRQRRGAAELVGTIMALVAVAGLVIGGIVTLVLLALGYR